MECRTSLVAYLLFSLLAAGCVAVPQRNQQPTSTSNSIKIGEAGPTSPLQAAAADKKQSSMISSMIGESAKDKDGPKRKPKPATVVALAEAREGEANKTEDESVRMKLFDQARQLYQHAIKLDTNCREAWLGVARVYTKMADYEHAYETYEKMLVKDPRDHQVWFDAAMCYNRQKKFDEACQCLNKALEFDPENRQYRQTLGFTLARAGQPDQAVAMLTKVEGPGQAHYHVARMMKHVGRTDLCKRHLELALQANPNHEQARGLLASLQPQGLPGSATPATLPAPAPAPAPTLSLAFPE